VAIELSLETEVHVNLDPRDDGLITMSDALSSFVTTNCNGNDWAILAKAGLSASLKIGPPAFQFTLTIPAEMDSQFLLRNDGADVAWHFSLAITVQRPRKLGDIWADWEDRVGETLAEQIEEFVCTMLPVPKSMNPFCRDGFALYRSSSLSVTIRFSSDEVSSSVEVDFGSSSQKKLSLSQSANEWGWKFCVDDDCVDKICMVDTDCGGGGSVSGYHCAHSTMDFTCQPVYGACLCGYYYENDPFTYESCEGYYTCYVDWLLALTAEKSCQQYGGGDYCILKAETPEVLSGSWTKDQGTSFCGRGPETLRMISTPATQACPAASLLCWPPRWPSPARSLL